MAYSMAAKWESTEYPAIFGTLKNTFKADAKVTITREDIKEIGTTDKPCFILHNVLSKEECKLLIEASEAQGFEEASKYCHFYRDRYNDRLMSDDDAFSDLVWKRVKDFLPKTVMSWELHSLNRRWRYCRYYAGHFFGAHTDGTYSYTEKKRQYMSALTFMLYLDSPKDGSYEGGHTNYLTLDGKIKYSVEPETGMALVFLQEDRSMLHEGSKVTKGSKHILRSDVMYLMPDLK
jgi:hypothetical protein